jgi:hypothetical protein
MKILSADKKTSLKHPFTCITADPTCSGKTVLIRRILKHRKSHFFKNGSIDILIWQKLKHECSYFFYGHGLCDC